MRIHCYCVILIVLGRAARLQPLIAPFTGNKFRLIATSFSFVISQHADLYQLSSRNHFLFLLFPESLLPASIIFALFFFNRLL
jgi:hypothetical protein